eukprot:TRINITY_DN14993_c0_g4_i1.p1 TRINITY_DN14993_c0_g4~~TRINITY_DN14993_c0_g4_i1.p1  ORF type:complete len:529 (+),score=107.06 TRINITY_DN14993_c0_g4_i1:57-1643(+)
MGWGHLVPVAIVALAVNSAFSFYKICYPTFPEFDSHHRPLKRHGPVIHDQSNMSVQLSVSRDGSRKSTHLATRDFVYGWEDFQGFEIPLTVNVSRSLLSTSPDANVWLKATVVGMNQKPVAVAKAKLLKYLPRPTVRPKRHLLSGEICPEPLEFGRSGGRVVRGLPQIKVELVHDLTQYPQPWANGPYLPQLYADEFWVTNDALVTLNGTEDDSFETVVSFNLMPAARWRFQLHMEQALAQNAKIFGEDSEEMVQMRDLMANTDPVLLIATMVISFLHMIFEYLAFKADVNFWQATDGEVIHKFISIKSLVAGIFCQFILLLYLWDEQSNLLVLGFSAVGIGIDVWKVKRVMVLQWHLAWGLLPLPYLQQRSRSTSPSDGKAATPDFDGQACRWLSVLLAPGVLSYAIYSLVYDCHRGVYSYVLSASAAMVYTLGFVLMTPQLFINYKTKSVAHLPWRRFVYRAINTFIDDLFSFIIRMPTMHRISCFRDDVVFLVYLWQRQVYPVDKDRVYDEDEGPSEHPRSKKRD